MYVLPVTPKLPIIPDMPHDVPMVDPDGMMNRQWKTFFDQLTASLELLFKSEGYVIPALTAAQIAELTGQASYNNIVFDSTNGAFKGNINGTWFTFAMAPGGPLNTFLTMTP